MLTADQDMSTICQNDATDQVNFSSSVPSLMTASLEVCEECEHIKGS